MKSLLTEIIVPKAPAVPGLIFRHFRGEDDYPGIVAAILASVEADRVEITVSVEEMARVFQHLANCDPYQDLLLAEVDGEIVAYSRGWWVDDLDGTRLYRFSGYLTPAWRRKGIGSVMVDWMENHLRAVAATHPPEIAKFFRPSGIDYRETGAIAMLTRAGYRPIRYFHNMVRPTLEDIQDFPLPEGLEVRPARLEHYRFEEMLLTNMFI